MNLQALFFGSLVLTAISASGQTTLFQQNFDAGAPVSQYVSSNPNVGQFNGINGPDGAVSIVDGTLHFERLVNKTTGHFSRTTNFSPVPGSLYIQLDFEVVSTTTVAGAGALIFAVGSSLGNGVTLDVPDIYARFGIGFTGQGYAFQARTIPFGGGGNEYPSSGGIVGKQRFTFILNNTGYTVTYLQPSGGTKKLLDDKYDLWVGNTLAFENQPVLNPNQTMTNFKLRIDDDVYAAIFQFDNILIRDVTGVLPLDVTYFAAEAQGPHVHLTWQTARPQTGSYTIERRTATGEFTDVGTLPAHDVPDNQRTYAFTDEHPAAGLTYYRLRHVDHEGVATWSKLVSVRYEPNQPALVLLDNPVAAGVIRVRTHALPAPTYLLTTLTGQPVACLQRETPEGEVTLQPQHSLPSGVYLLSATSGFVRLTKRVVMP